MSVKIKITILIMMLSSLLLLGIIPGTTQMGDTSKPVLKPDTTTPVTPTPAGTGPVRTITPALGSFPGNAGKPVNPDEFQVSISYTKADIANILSFLSAASAVPIVVDAELKGNVTIISIQKVSLTVAYQVINSALRVRGYSMIGGLQDKIIRVVPIKNIRAERAEVRINLDPLTLTASDNVITQVIPLMYANAGKLKDELKPLISDEQANIISISNTNSLIVTDTEGNVSRLLQIIKLMDRDTSDVTTIKVYICKHASATQLLKSLTDVFEVKKTSTGATPNQPRPPEGNPNQPAPTSTDGLLSLKGEIHLSVDNRINAIIISASPTKIQTILDLIEQLDIDTTPDVKAQIFELQYADAKLVAEQLTKIFKQPAGTSTGYNPYGFNPYGAQPSQETGFIGLKENTVVADVRTNTVVVTATEQNMSVFKDMIERLDSPTKLGEITRSFPLKYASAKNLATILTQLFRGNSSSRFSFYDIFYGGGNNSNDGDPISSLKNITVVAEEKSNTLLITGSPQSFTMVEKIITDLDKRAVQVFIQVAIVDVTLDDTTKFGVEWKWNSDHLAPGTTTPKSTTSTNFDLKAQTLGLKYSVLSNNLQALLAALETQSNVKVYSTPSITTADNVQAMISIGQDIPFVTSENTTEGGTTLRTVDFKNVSIALTVTPHVNGSSSLISLEVLQTINELIGRDVELNSPIVANRQAKTTVMVNDGQTIVIGGIIKENSGRATSGVPLLSKIPLLGELFKSRTLTKQKSELMVFLTPHILGDESDILPGEQTIDSITQQQQQKLSDPAKVEVTPKK